MDICNVILTSTFVDETIRCDLLKVLSHQHFLLGTVSFQCLHTEILRILVLLGFQGYSVFLFCDGS